MRAAHACRSLVKAFIGSDARCPVCAKVFSTRLRAIAHATEKRRRNGRATTCREALLSGRFQPLPEHELAQLDGADRSARRAAYKSGYTQPRSLWQPSRKRPEPVTEPAPGPLRQPRRRLRVKTSVAAPLSRPCPAPPGEGQRPAKRLRVKTSPCHLAVRAPVV